MAHFLYYVEDMHGFSHRAVESAGLAYALGNGCTRAECRTGPGNAAGMVLTIAGRCGYYPETQVWRRMRDKVWIGYEKNAPPTEEELRRPKQLESYPVEMASGETWRVPLAVEWYESDGQFCHAPAVPAYAELDDNGRWRRGDVRPEYSRLWEISCMAWDVFFAGESPEGKEIASNDARSLAAEVLAVNYRVGPYECSALRLFNDPATVAVEVIKACCGWPIVADWQKKREAQERSASAATSGSGGVVA